MKQCDTCVYGKYKNDLFCCCSSQLHFELVELVKRIPLFGRDVADYECTNYEPADGDAE